MPKIRVSGWEDGGASALSRISPDLMAELERVPLGDDAFRVWKRFAFWTVMAMKLVARVAVRLGRQLEADDLAKIVRVDPLETSSRELKCKECGMPWTPLMRTFVHANGTFSEKPEDMTGDFFVIGAAGVGYKLRLACSNRKEGETCFERMLELTKSPNALSREQAARSRRHGLTWEQARKILAEKGVTARL